MIRFGNAPCSWGTIEGWGQGIGYAQMLDELAATGYEGTELGDWGYMPTDPSALRRELESRHLTMLSAYEGVNLRDEADHESGEARVVRNATLLASVADAAWKPMVVLADDHSRDPVRFHHAGRVQPDMQLSDADFRTFAAGANRIARAVLERTGLRTVFHHHCAGYVETPLEIERFLALTDPGLVGLVFDTGHALFGSGGSDPSAVLDMLEGFRERLWYVHFKDMHEGIAAQARREGWTYKQSIAAGVFCELGQGVVPFQAVLDDLKAMGYEGWITVEQDVLPGMGEPADSARRNREFIATLESSGSRGSR